MVTTKEAFITLTDFLSDERLKGVRYDELYDPDFDKKLSVTEVLVRSIARQDSALADTFDCASSDEIYDSEAMPADQPNTHPVGADRPANILGSITELRDRQVFNERIFENPVQKAEKQAEVVVPASIDVADMSWKCGRCEFENQPVKKDSGQLVMGSIQGVYQNHQCGRCRNWLIGRNEIRREVRHEEQVERDREAVVAEHPRAIPIPGTEAERTNMTDVLAGKRVINPGQE